MYFSQRTFEFTPTAQLWPRSLNADIGGDPDGIFLIVGDLGTDSGEGLDFISTDLSRHRARAFAN